jgi:acetoin utilization protein AcuB
MVWAAIRHLPVTHAGKLLGLVTEQDLALAWARDRGTASARVDSVMHPSPQTCGADDSIIEVTARMASDKLSCLPVVDKGRLVGIVTTTDILGAHVQNAMSPPVERGPTVADAMTPNPATAHPDDHLLDAVARMRSISVRHLPVVDGEGKALGMLSDRDVRAAIGDPSRVSLRGDDPEREELRVGNAMSTPAITVTGDRRCAEVAREFARLRASAVPVTDSNNVVIGILSYIDLLRALSRRAG